VKQFCTVFTIIFILICTSLSFGAYKIPPKEIVDIIDAPVPPPAIISPDGSYILPVKRRLYPPVTFLARPSAALAGLRIDTEHMALQRITQYHGLELIDVKSGSVTHIEIPQNRLIDPPSWSFDSQHFAFTAESDKGLSLHVYDVASRKLRAFPDIHLTNVLGNPYRWLPDNTHLLIRLCEQGSTLPKDKNSYISPNLEETSGHAAKVRTFQNLLKSAYDEKLFEFYGRSVFAILDIITGKVTRIGGPDLYLDGHLSPNGQYMVVTRLLKPYSHKVPYDDFAQSVEIWDRNGKTIALIARLPVMEEVPTDGVPTGPRMVNWQPLHGARLYWLEALDNGDPMKKAEFRDRIMSFNEPFKGNPRELLKMQHRFWGIQFLPEKDCVILHDFDRAREWTTISLVNLSKGSEGKRLLFERNIKDDYQHPGVAVQEVYNNSCNCVARDGDFIYLSGKGASPAGEHPFLAKLNISNGEKNSLFKSEKDKYETFERFFHRDRDELIIRSESVQSPPNYYLLNLKKQTRIQLTHNIDPTPQLRTFAKELVKYKRADGVELSGTLYLPAGYLEGTRLPLMMWAYPLEYTDTSVAGQVRGSPSRFTFFQGSTPLFFLTQGYAVLYNAAMPVVGNPETKNNTFVEQIVSSAQAAIDYLDGRGIIDRKRVAVGGHSYGAFMTANLLAHSRLFAVGIARSGAYNRTLTPFGFQNERRSFWEAPEIYIRLSPFTYADRIKDPLLLIHGDSDDNPGTFPIQSERLFDAINGNGGISRLVILPYEGHDYRSRESVLHVIAEMFEWGQRFVKNR